MDLTRILCPVDFSETSAQAVEQAIALAGWSHARITALHVCNPAYMPVPGVPPPAERVPAAEIQRAHDETAKCFSAATAAGVAVDVIVDVGQPVRHILSRAIYSSADLIVMGTHGASGFEHLVLGSVTEKILRRAPCAVLTVPPRAHATSKLPFARVLCAVDFSDPSLAALRLAQSLACDAQAALTVLHVIEWPWDEPPAPDFTQLPREQAAALAEYRRYVETTATGRLQTLLPEPVQQRCVARARVSHGTAHVEILRVAAEEQADLIVIGVHGRNAIDMMLFGSTTNQVVRRATCPVLTLRK
ncbi:MAG: universal stress protein [Acidobacteria bacterium]|nr:universal stress protein [Acidobacteriota bacterium]